MSNTRTEHAAILKQCDDAYQRYRHAKAELGKAEEGSEEYKSLYQKAEGFFNESEELLVKAKRLERELAVDDFVTDPQRSHPFAGVKTATAIEVTSKALEKLGKGMPHVELEESERKTLARHQVIAYNRWLHCKDASEMAAMSDFDKSVLATMKAGDFRGYRLPYNAKALSTLDDLQGGLATSFEKGNELITELRSPTAVRNMARVIPTSKPGVTFPSIKVDTTFTKTGQSKTITPTNLGEILGRTEIAKHKFTLILKAPMELVEDQDFNLIGFLMQELALEWNEQEESLFLNGSGNGEPYGMLTAYADGLIGSYAITGASGALVQPEDIYAMVYQLTATERALASWTLPRQGVFNVRVLKDGNDQFYWKDGLQAGQPATLAGYPVTEIESFPDNWTGTSQSAGDPLGIFGSWGFGYWIVDDPRGMTVETLRELYAEDDEVGYKHRIRVGGSVVRVAPQRVLKCKATT